MARISRKVLLDRLAWALGAGDRPDIVRLIENELARRDEENRKRKVFRDNAARLDRLGQAASNFIDSH